MPFMPLAQELPARAAINSIAVNPVFFNVTRRVALTTGGKKALSF
jgi:hypothetical protein